MGLDITVFMVDWEQLARIPADDRVNVLGDAACPDFCCEACEDADHALTGGWAGRPAGYDAAAALLREWGDVATEAGARGWGLVGLPF
ncbi:hypothetical protein [Streptomyces sp. NPDC055005]